MITINYNNWKTRPLLVSFGTKEVPIYSIPFPAVTICPERKFDNKYFNSNAIRKKFDNNETLTDEEYVATTIVLAYLEDICFQEEIVNSGINSLRTAS